jgi:type IV pilus assembly protein PilX
MRNRQTTKPGNRQDGVALFISLVLLLVLTIIGVSAVQSTSLEVRMARNDQDSLLAFQAAESALRDGEDFLDGITSTAAFVDNGAAGLWTVADFNQTPRWQTAGLWTSNQSVTATNAIAGVAEQPRFIVEHVASVLREENAYQLDDPYASGSADRIEMFRITARGVGGTAAAAVTLQSTFGRVFN